MLRQIHPEVNLMGDLVQQFVHMLRTRTGEQLDTWLTKVSVSRIPELQSFVLPTGCATSYPKRELYTLDTQSYEYGQGRAVILTEKSQRSMLVIRLRSAFSIWFFRHEDCPPLSILIRLSVYTLQVLSVFPVAHVRFLTQDVRMRRLY